jgi:hypothetical protein
MGMNYESELRACGCALGRDQFFELIQDIRVQLYPSWTEDELACNPRDAIRFCDEVRRRANAQVPDNVTMHAMFAARKHG